MHAAVANCCNILPAFDLIGDLRFGFRSGGSPRENNDFWISGGDLFVSHGAACGQDHVTSGDFDELGYPGRRTDAWIRPRFGVDTHAARFAAALCGDGFEIISHAADHALGSRDPISETAEEANVAVDVSQRTWIHGQEIERALKELGYGFLFVRHGANHQAWPQAEDFVDGVQVPAIAEFRDATNWSDVCAPFGDADERAFGADCAENRRCAWSKRDNAKRRSMRSRHRLEFSRDWKIDRPRR